MKVLLGHLDWGMGTKCPYSDPADKTFFGLCVVSSVSKQSKLLFKMGQKLLSAAPVLVLDTCKPSFLNQENDMGWFLPRKFVNLIR